MEKNRLPERKTIRLQNFDYRSKGAYHVTICTKDRNCIFGYVKDGNMVLNELGTVAEQKIAEVSDHYPEYDIIASVVMPNHVHMLVGLGIGADAAYGVPTVKHTLGQIVGAYKASVSRAVGHAIWQSRYYEHIIRNDIDLQDTMEYILNNPIAWDKDDLYRS